MIRINIIIVNIIAQYFKAPNALLTTTTNGEFVLFPIVSKARGMWGMKVASSLSSDKCKYMPKPYMRRYYVHVLLCF